MILLIDNFDSFVYNLARYFEELGEETRVERNDALTVAEIRAMSPRAIVLSPGPCDPASAGVSVPVTRELGSSVPMLGVCLGHQAIGAAYGARIIRTKPFHGRTSRVFHQESGLFGGVPSPFRAARYHSLAVCPEDLPEDVDVTATTSDGTVMALRHKRHPVFGIQFHPESVLTEYGHRLLANFLSIVASTTRTACSRFSESA